VSLPNRGPAADDSADDHDEDGVDDSGSKLDPHASACHTAGGDAAGWPPPGEEAVTSTDVHPDRRRFVGRAGRTIAVAAPLILMFRPSTAYAASASSS